MALLAAEIGIADPVPLVSTHTVRCEVSGILLSFYHT